LRGEEAPTPGQIDAFKKIITNVIEKGQNKKKKKNVKPQLIMGMKTKEEIEKMIFDHLVVNKNYKIRLICENDMVEIILAEVSERLTNVVYPNKMKYYLNPRDHKGKNYVMFTIVFNDEDNLMQPPVKVK
jgi:hypothetical protein